MLSKKSKLSFIIFIASLAVILSVTIMTLWLTGAWFTDSKSADSDITTATISVQAKQGETVHQTTSPITLTSGSLISNSNKIVVKNTSSTSVYLRAKITCNWDVNDASEYDMIYDVLSFTLGSNWGALTGSNGNDKIFNNNYIYYNTSVASNGQVDLLTAVSIKAGKSMPTDALLNVVVEVVQADNIGKTLFINNDVDLTSSNISTVIS